MAAQLVDEAAELANSPLPFQANHQLLVFLARLFAAQKIEVFSSRNFRCLGRSMPGRRRFGHLSRGSKQIRLYRNRYTSRLEGILFLRFRSRITILQRIPNELIGNFVTALVLRMPAMATHPLPVDFVFVGQGNQSEPEIPVWHWLIPAHEVVALPARQPLGHALNQVLRVRGDDHATSQF